MAALQPIEYTQYSYGVFEKKHYMECTTDRWACDSLVSGLGSHARCVSTWRCALLRSPCRDHRPASPCYRPPSRELSRARWHRHVV